MDFDEALGKARVIAFAMAAGALFAAIASGVLIATSAVSPFVGSQTITYIRIAVIGFAAFDFLIGLVVVKKIVSTDAREAAEEPAENDEGNTSIQKLFSGTLVGLALGEGPAFAAIGVSFVTRSYIDVVLGLIILAVSFFRYFPTEDGWRQKLREFGQVQS